MLSQLCIVPGCQKPGIDMVLGNPTCLQHVSFIAGVIENYLNSQQQKALTCQTIESTLPIKVEPTQSKPIKEPEPVNVEPKSVEMECEEPKQVQKGCQSGIAGTRCYGEYHDCNNQWGFTQCRNCHTVEKYTLYLEKRGVDPTEYYQCQGPKWKGVVKSSNCEGLAHRSYAKRCYASDKVGGTDVFMDMRKEMDDYRKHH